MRVKLLALAAMFVICSCSGVTAGNRPAATTSAPPLPPPNYLVTGGDGSQDGSWAIDMDLASGTLYEAELEGQKVISAAGTVSLQGNTLNLSVQVPSGTALLPGGTYAATTSGDGLQVAVPWSDGSVHTYPFSQQTLDAYNQFVGLLNAAAQQAIAAAQQAADQAAQQAAQAQQAAAQAAAQLQQQEKAAAAKLATTATQACAAVGGQIQGANNISVTIHQDGSQSVWMGAFCIPGPNRTWQGTAGPITCGGLSVQFNDDGSLNQGDLRSTKQSYPGCFG